MTAHRAIALLAAAAGCASATMPASAQVADGIVLNTLRECARIEEAGARLSCYDNNIRASAAGERAPEAARGVDVPQAGQAAPRAAAGRGVAGFGGEDVRVPRQSAGAQASAPASQSSRVTRVDPREPGVYLLTLDDGTQWQFAESVDRSYRVPRNGDGITINRGALGGYLMRFNDQMGIRIRRIR